MEDIRVKRLRELLVENFGGSQTELSRRTGVSLAQLGQYFSGYRNMGEKVARKVESGAGKPKGWLDTDDGDKLLLTEDERLHLAAWRAASTEVREVTSYVLAGLNAPQPAWATTDHRYALGSMLYAALCWLREEAEPKKIAA